MKTIMFITFILGLLISISVHAQLVVHDPVALLKDDNARADVLRKQTEEIIRRSKIVSAPCAQLLSPLPGPKGPVPYASALAAMNELKVANYLPPECIDTLLQNMSFMKRSPTLDSVMHELISLDLSYTHRVMDTRVCEAPADTGLAGLLAFTKNVQTINSCAQLQKGKWKKVSGKSSYGDTINYSMFQETTGNIRIALNVKLTQIHSGGSVSNQTMLNRMRSCMRTTSEFLKGPSGEKIIFDLLTPEETQKLPEAVRPKEHTIKIDHSPNTRANSEKYGYQIDCPTIAHEVMHMLGLADEYVGDGDGNFCRAIPRHKTLMRSQHAFNSTVPHTLSCQCTSANCVEALNRVGRAEFIKAPRLLDLTSLRFRNTYCSPGVPGVPVPWEDTNAASPIPASTITLSNDGLKLTAVDAYFAEGWKHVFSHTIECACPANDGSCQRILTSLNNDQSEDVMLKCPYGLTQKDFIWGVAANDRVENDTLIMGVKPNGGQLLHPTHIKRILGGTCPTTTKTYNECTKEAYTESEQACKKVPSYCFNPNYLDLP